MQCVARHRNALSTYKLHLFFCDCECFSTIDKTGIHPAVLVRNTCRGHCSCRIKWWMKQKWAHILSGTQKNQMHSYNRCIFSFIRVPPTIYIKHHRFFQCAYAQDYAHALCRKVCMHQTLMTSFQNYISCMWFLTFDLVRKKVSFMLWRISYNFHACERPYRKYAANCPLHKTILSKDQWNDWARWATNQPIS